MSSWSKHTPDQKVALWGIPKADQAKVPANSDGSKFAIVLVPDGTGLADVHGAGYSASGDRLVGVGQTDALEKFQDKGLQAFVHLNDGPRKDIASGSVYEAGRTVIIVRLASKGKPSTGTCPEVDYALNDGYSHYEMGETLDWLCARFA